MEQFQSIDFYYEQHLDVKEEALRDIQRMVSEGNFFFDGDYDSRGNEVCFAHQPDGYPSKELCGTVRHLQDVRGHMNSKRHA